MLRTNFGEKCDTGQFCQSADLISRHVPCPKSGTCPKCAPGNMPTPAMPCNKRKDGRTIELTDVGGHSCCVFPDMCGSPQDFYCKNGSCTQLLGTCHATLRELCPYNHDTCHDCIEKNKDKLLASNCTMQNLQGWCGGYCKSDEAVKPEGYPFCACATGWGGPNCDGKICPGKCLNRGECLNGECNCPYVAQFRGVTLGLTGNKCQTAINPCDQNPCGANTTCKTYIDPEDGLTKWECQCKRGWTKSASDLQDIYAPCTLELPPECEASQVNCEDGTDCLIPTSSVPGVDCSKACYVIPETRNWHTNCANHPGMELSGPGPSYDNKTRGCTCKRDYHDPVHAPLLKFDGHMKGNWKDLWATGGCKDGCPPFYANKH